MKICESNIKEALSAITQNDFSSHDVIEKFAYLYESDYIDMLNEYKGDDAFRKVHSQIGAFLSNNSNLVGIKKTGRSKNINIFGHDTEVQYWEKI